MRLDRGTADDLQSVRESVKMTENDDNIVETLKEDGYEVVEGGEAVLAASEQLHESKTAERVADLYIVPGDKDSELERLEGVEAVLDLGGEMPDSESDEFEDDENFNIVESSLPSEALVRGGGRIKESPVAAVGTKNGLQVFLGSDGLQHIEVPRARAAFEDYFNLGRDRSLRKLAEIYAHPDNTQWTNNFQGIHRKLQEYSANLDWQNRIRLLITQQSAQALASAQRSAANYKRNRIARAEKMQRIGEKILDRAMILDEVGIDNPLTPAEARLLIKPATVLLQVGMQLSRAEIGESLERIKPSKPVDQMSDEELDEYIDVLRTELQ